MTWQVVLAVSFTLGIGFPALVKPLLLRLNLVDVPNHRSSHQRVTLRGGGIAIILVALVTWLWFAFFRDDSVHPALLWSIGAVICFGILGLAEDLKELPVKVRIAGQFLLSLAFGWGLCGALGLSLLWLLLIPFAGVFLINAANFMDGTNGISGLHGTATGATALIAGSMADDVSLMVFGCVVLGAFGGFLPWNFPKAQMFLGDVGSYALGASMWAAGIWVWASTGSVLFAVAPFLVYSADVIFTLARRLARRVDVTEAHREHVYQRINQAYGSHVWASGVPATFTAVLVFLAVLTVQGRVNSVTAFGGGITFIIGYCLLVFSAERKIAQVSK